MADPLLTTLCSICHTAVPKYTCPACRAHTCSLTCAQRHKAWANCTGRRDPTAYMPASRLRTPAGVDHDYNFLSAIERERDRNQREIVEERGLFSERQLRELGEDRRWRRMWFGEEVRFVSNDRGPPNKGGAVFGSDGEDGDEDEGDQGDKGRRSAGRGPPSALARRVRQRLDHANIEVVHMPAGMTRQRENTTAWNRKTGRINWCVEWIVYDAAGLGTLGGGASSMRVRHKALETSPLYKALGNSLAWFRKGRQKDEDEDEEDGDAFLSAYARKRQRALIKEVREEGRRSAMQDADEATWLSAPYASQNPYTGTWDSDRAATVSSWLPDELIDAMRHHKFYLLRPLTPAGKPKELIPLESTETLGRALMGRTVLEFPTVYVLPPLPAAAADELPEGFVLGSTERRVRERRNNNNTTTTNRSEKRKAGCDRGGERSQPPHKRQAVGEDGIPMRGGRHDRGRGRGRGSTRGRGGGRGQQHRQEGDGNPDAEEGEINSDSNDYPRPAQGVGGGADTTSSDPDTSSDEDGSLGGMSGDEDNMALEGQGEPPAGQLRPPTTATGKSSGLGLVDYGSDSEDDAGSESEDVDVSELKPENPELVAGAIQEIVGLLS